VTIEGVTTEERRSYLMTSHRVPLKGSISGGWIQSMGSASKIYNLDGYLIVDEVKTREEKRAELEEQIASNTPIRLDIPGIGTRRVIIKDITFSEVAGEPNSYSFRLSCVEV